jgi:serine/threonine-protein kinase
MPPPSGSIVRCPEHGLALIDRHELAQGDGDALLGATIAGRFTILGRLGRGSMGSVYRARQQAVGRDVALKIVRRDRASDPETKARFEREARAVSSLTSPHTITAFDFGEAEDGSWFLAMEMLEGETVGDRLRRERRIDWLDAARFARDALRALAEAHAKGIIHRDLKPDNLFLARLPEEGGRRHEICKVLDFGIAKWQGGEESTIDQLETQAGTVFGTPRYMSPEQAQGRPLDARSDLYSLGVLLYQMLSGRAPFTDDDAVVVMARHIKDAPPTLADVAAEGAIPPPLEEVVFRALAKSPDDRPQSAEEMAGELEAAVEASRAFASGVQRAHSEAPPADVSERKRGVPRSLVVTLVLGVAVAGVLALRSFTASNVTSNVSVTPLVPESAARSSAPAPVVTEPTVTPSVSVTERVDAPSNDAAQTTENSSVGAASASSARAPSKQRVVRARPSSSSPNVLPRKANERYGRFE